MESIASGEHRAAQKAWYVRVSLPRSQAAPRESKIKIMKIIIMSNKITKADLKVKLQH